MHEHTHANTYVHAHTQARTHTRTHTHKHTNAHTLTRTDTHTQTHTHTHTHKQTNTDTPMNTHLLDVRREAHERLRVGQQRARGVPQERRVPHAEQSHYHGQVRLERRGREVRVHGLRALKEPAHHGEAIVDREGADAHRGADAARRRPHA
jgi:hypothetical protein